MEVLGKRLKWLRNQNRYSQKEIADKIGMSASGLQKIENNERDPKLDVLIQLSFIYNVSTDFLLGIHDNTNHLFKESLMIDLYRIQLDELQLKISEITMQSYSLEARIDDMNSRIRSIGESQDLSINKAKLNDMYQMRANYERQVYELNQERNKLLIEYIKDIISIPEVKPYKDHIIKDFVPFNIEIQPDIFDEYALQIYGKSIGFIGHLGLFKTVEEADQERINLLSMLNGTQYENILR